MSLNQESFLSSSDHPLYHLRNEYGAIDSITDRLSEQAQVIMRGMGKYITDDEGKQQGHLYQLIDKTGMLDRMLRLYGMELNDDSIPMSKQPSDREIMRFCDDLAEALFERNIWNIKV